MEKCYLLKKKKSIEPFEWLSAINLNAIGGLKTSRNSMPQIKVRIFTFEPKMNV